MLIRRLARPMLASYFLAEGVKRLKEPQPLAEEAKPFVEMLAQQTGVPNNPELAVQAAGGAQLLGGALLASGRLPRPSAALLAGTLAPTTYIHDAFWAESDPKIKAQKRATFLRNVAILGGLILATVDTEGKPSLRWRAVRGANDTGRSARYAARAAKREAKLLAVQAGNTLS